MPQDTCYPNTYACDYIRSLAGYDKGSTKISRSDASAIRQGIARAIGMEDDELARKLADYAKKNEDEIIQAVDNLTFDEFVEYAQAQLN
jgi:hypothetical protein